MRCHLTAVRIGIIRKSTNNKCWKGCGEKGTLVHCWWECKLIQPLWKTAQYRSSLKNLKIELPYNPIIPFPGICPKEMRTGVWRHICTPMFTATLLTVTKIWKQSKCLSTDECIQRCDIYVYNGILFCHEKDGILQFATPWIDL